MAYLLDTGILLRLVNIQDELHTIVQQAVERLIAQREDLYITTQNVSELWNVATRPVSANGLGLPIPVVLGLLRQLIEPICSRLIENEATYENFKRLGSTYEFAGKQAHDGRLVAIMLSRQIKRILTLNERDFLRYEPEGIVIATPASILGSKQ